MTYAWLQFSLNGCVHQFYQKLCWGAYHLTKALPANTHQTAGQNLATVLYPSSDVSRTVVVLHFRETSEILRAPGTGLMQILYNLAVSTPWLRLPSKLGDREGVSRRASLPAYHFWNLCALCQWCLLAITRKITSHLRAGPSRIIDHFPFASGSLLVGVQEHEAHRQTR